MNFTSNFFPPSFIGKDALLWLSIIFMAYGITQMLYYGMKLQQTKKQRGNFS